MGGAIRCQHILFSRFTCTLWDQFFEVKYALPSIEVIFVGGGNLEVKSIIRESIWQKRKRERERERERNEAIGPKVETPLKNVFGFGLLRRRRLRSKIVSRQMPL